MEPFAKVWVIAWDYPAHSQRRVAQIVLDAPDDEPAARHAFLNKHPYANIRSARPVGRVPAEVWT
jgi:hypothetical protein